MADFNDDANYDPNDPENYADVDALKGAEEPELGNDLNEEEVVEEDSDL